MRVRPKKSLGMDPELRVGKLEQAFWHVNRARDLLLEAECRTETIDKVGYATLANLSKGKEQMILGKQKCKARIKQKN